MAVSLLAAGKSGRVAPHRTGQTAAERLCRVLYWEVARRVAQRERCSARSAMHARLWPRGRTTTTPSDHTAGSAISRPSPTPTQCSQNAMGRGAALYAGLRAPSRCFAEPDRLKSTWATHRWMKEGAQVIQRVGSLTDSRFVAAVLSFCHVEFCISLQKTDFAYPH
jgi:hypothetical protein